MNTLVVKDEIAIDLIIAECESIIACTENVYEFLTDQELNTFDLNELEIDTIRCTAEEMQSLVCSFADDFSTNDSKQEIVDLSITLYQDCKYILEDIENENSFLMTDEIAKQFSYIRASVDNIRTVVEKL